MPLLVTPAFASGYLMAMAAGNLGGRIGWAALSDKIGRWNTFQGFTLIAVPLFAGIPFLITQCVSNPTGPRAPCLRGRPVRCQVCGGYPRQVSHICRLCH